MPRKAADKPEKAAKPHIPDINWAANQSSLIWSLLAEIEKAENYRVLYGKKESSENTSGETKVTVYNRIAEAILPDMYALDPCMVGERVKSKLESLKKLYQNKAKHLLQTGEGVYNKGGLQGVEETLPFYIMGDGPCVETPPHAVNIWKQIEKEFIFFPTLHRIFASRPNATPIVITTALGLHGQKTVWYQLPNDDNSNIDPELLKESVHAPADHPTPQRERSFGNDAAGAVNANAQGPGLAFQGSMTPGPQRGPRPSVSSREAIETVRKNASKVPQKRSLADTLMQIQRENLAAQKEQNQSRINIELRKQIIDERKQIIDELKLGLWTIKQAQEKIAALEKEDDPRPSKRQKSSRKPSPDWDEISSSSD